MAQSPADKKTTKAKSPAPSTEGPGYLSFDQITAVDDRPVRDVDIPEWGGKVKIQAWTKLAQGKVMDASIDRETGRMDTIAYDIAAICECVIEPALTEEQVKALMRKSATAVDRITQEIVLLNATGAKAIDEAEATFPPAS